VIWYNGALTATEIQKVESYLALKYGVSLDQTSPRDYVASDGTTKMRDATLAGIYSKDIAGIGRDDASALNQKQSTSVNSNLITMGLGTIATSNAVNTSPFLTDKTFLSWANDGGSVANWSGTNTPNNYYSLPRNWQMQLVNNGVGSVQLRATNLPTDMGTVSLLLDDDGNFTNGGTQAFQMTQKGSEYEVNFTPSASVAYFTIATRLPDTTPPVAVLNGNTIMTIIQGTTYIEAGATWTDNYDGTGTINPASSGSVDTSTPGTYTLEYRYTDQAGNQSNMVTRIVEILPKNIIGNLIYTPAGPAWTS
jgi:hypothetical protein